MRFAHALLVLLAFIVLSVQNASAHEVRPGLLDIKETRDGWFEVVLKTPVLNGQLLDIAAEFPDSFLPVGNTVKRELPAAIVETATYRMESGSITGMPITISGLNAVQTDVLVQISLLSGASHSAILKPSAPTFVVPETLSNWEVFRDYTHLGIAHILGGIDHLLFVLALVLIIRDRWLLFKTVTAFTVAHSITLALAALGTLNMPSGPTEAVIALSIVFLAAESVQQSRGKDSLTQQLPWLVSFGFGLVHGLGFAGALSDIGLPDHAIPLALLSFNVGVELGQITFIFAVLALSAIARKIYPVWPTWSRALPAYAIGTVASYWTIDRVVGLI